MTQSQRDRLAAPVVLVYWLMLAGGLMLYSALRLEDLSSVVPLWIGAMAGTAVGQCLALRDLRFWVVAVTLALLLAWGMPLAPDTKSFDGTHLFMALVPATLCGFWSLTDRGSLVAFWFPAVIWMLSILDRTDGKTTPDGVGVVLLGGLAVLFIVFLRVRESRRVGLWRTVGATPIATAKPSVLLKEPPGSQFARAGWALLVSSITFAVTAWVAPLLWQIESFDGDPVTIAGGGPAGGLPCCSATEDADAERSRVKEYFDIGRGHDEFAMPQREGIDCQPCDGSGIAITACDMEYGFDDRAYGAPVLPAPNYGDVIVPPPHGLNYNAYRTPNGYRNPSTFTPTPGFVRPAPSTVPPSYQPSPSPSVVPAPNPAPAPPVITPIKPHVATVPPPIVTPPVPTIPPVAPSVTPTPPPPSITPPPAHAATPPAATPSSTIRPRRPASAALGPSLLQWVAVLVGAALLFQLVGLALRPLRRSILLRHLRNPFWDETVDQRVSNSWQLALVGLRDAGWRSSSGESPREFARRAGVDGLERCASILERARHGIGIDTQDLSDMTTSADLAYRSARAGISPLAGVAAAVRWPLT